jgi:hypothetical protein
VADHRNPFQRQGRRWMITINPKKPQRNRFNYVRRNPYM